MRITSVRVDGYGLFADHAIEQVPDGLCVVYGPNEAGKSTLLDFVRGVLFGFPDRRSRSRYHEPLRGGRHGGAIGLVDDKGESYLLERHVGTRGPRLFDAHGRAAEPGALTRVLGGADEALFRSVFAFGLAELAEFSTLERDEVREVVFSAGVLGAGRSATRAQRALRDREEALVRARQHDAVANGLARRLGELDEELRAASGEARDFPTARANLDALRAELDEERASAEARRTRIGELDRLLSLAPVLARRDEARARLAELGELGETARHCLERQAAIEGLRAGLSGYEEQCATRDRLASSLASIDAELAAHLRECGVAEEAALLATVSPAQRELVDALADERVGLLETVRAQQDTFATERASETAAREQLARESAGTPVRARDELAAAALDAAQLRRNAAERVRLRQELDAARREERLAAVAGARAGRGATTQTFALGAVAVVLAGLAGAALVGGEALLGGLVALAALAALAGTWWCGRRRPGARPEEGPGAVGAERDLERLREEAEQLARRLSVDADASPGALETLVERIEAERERRRVLDQLGDALADAVSRRERAERALGERRGRLAEIDLRAGDIVAEIGIDLPPRLEGLARTLEHLAQIQRLAQSRTSVARGLDAVAGRIDTFLAELNACANDALGLGHVGELEVRGRVDELVGALETARAERSAREALDATVRDAGRDLALCAGGPDALAQLGASGEPSWRAERARLDDEERAGADTLEGLVRAHQDAERALEERSSSARIAELCLEAAGVTGDLDEALETYAALHLARTMIADTLARYERERQPVVIARAAEHFARVTDDRYRSLVARESPDGRHHGIVAIDARGAQVDAGDLSTGTAEQLYLCLRLAFAETFAKSAVCLPLVLDDILVNFDPCRAAAVAGVVAEVATAHQVLAFTCHPQIVETLTAAAPSASVVGLAATVAP